MSACRVVAGLLVACLVVGCGASRKTVGTVTPSGVKTAFHRRAVEWRLSASVTGRLGAPLQDAAPAATRGFVVLLGGLSAADTSTSGVLHATARGARTVGSLPTALHDAAAATLGGRTYVFGGGDGIAQLDQIVRVPAAPAGHLPAPSSDQSGATIGNTAYVVGGYTGQRWLNTIVAFDAHHGARVVAHLPTAVRYAAVAAANGSLIIAGGSLPDGTASRAIYAWSPGQGRARLIGRLPAATTHAGAASLGDVAYIVGGRGASLDTPTDRVVAVDVRNASVRLAGRLPQPTSDAPAATLRGRILVFGGHTAGGTTDAIVSLVRRAPTTARRVTTANVYAADTPTSFHGAARHARQLVYVPNSLSNTVDVIDPHTYRIVEHFAVGALPQHVTPAWDLKTLYVLNDQGNSLTTINPTTGKPGRTIPVDDPYNMYFTPNGQYAIVVAERLHRLDFVDAHSFKLHHALTVPCAGIDHMDFSADGSYLIASCEFSGQLVKVDVASEQVVGALTLPDGAGAMPQDVKLSPDGRVFYVADMMANGLWKVDGDTFRVMGFLPTGKGTHGLYPSRDARLLYATNRGAGTISVIDFASEKVVHTWAIPGGGSPDMGGVSADGKVLWLSGRYSGVVYAISTTSGKLLAKIPVGSGPHGLCVWPQPGRYSLGHTGILR
ncbi:MAG TPA: YncE family protein [Gaiellaceae bacterium]|nr:YncE family protein [Gaiellaceae bacterium]